MIIFLTLWFLSGIIGYILYCLNGDTRPKKIGYLIVAFCTHTFFGLIGLFYGYVCFSSRKNKVAKIK